MDHLGGDNKKPAREERDTPPIKGLDYVDYHNSVRRTVPKSTPRVGEYAYQHVLLHVERTRVDRELSSGAQSRDPKLGSGEHGRHEPSDGEGGHLDGDLGDDEWLRSVGEELVEERQERARQHAQEPHPEGPHRQRRVVGVRYSQANLLYR